MPSKRRIYRVTFNNQGKVYEIFAKSVSQGALFGFVEVEGLLFGEKSAVLVDPTEETLQREFSGVERTYIPMHAIVRIDEVEKRGASRITADGSSNNVTQLATPIYTPIKRDR